MLETSLNSALSKIPEAVGVFFSLGISEVLKELRAERIEDLRQRHFINDEYRLNVSVAFK